MNIYCKIWLIAVHVLLLFALVNWTKAELRVVDAQAETRKSLKLLERSQRQSDESIKVAELWKSTALFNLEKNKELRSQLNSIK